MSTPASVCMFIPYIHTVQADAAGAHMKTVYFRKLVQWIREEFEAAPELRLTTREAAAFLGLDLATCERVLLGAASRRIPRARVGPALQADDRVLIQSPRMDDHSSPLLLQRAREQQVAPTHVFSEVVADRLVRRGGQELGDRYSRVSKPMARPVLLMKSLHKCPYATRRSQNNGFVAGVISRRMSGNGEHLSAPSCVCRRFSNS